MTLTGSQILSVLSCLGVEVLPVLLLPVVLDRPDELAKLDVRPGEDITLG